LDAPPHEVTLLKLKHIRLKEGYGEGEIAKGLVCNMNVDEETAKYISNVNGQKVYFCRAACKETFDKSPSKYEYKIKGKIH
jgi:YHS domain-containing protein